MAEQLLKCPYQHIGIFYQLDNIIFVIYINDGILFIIKTNDIININNDIIDIDDINYYR